MHAVNWSSVTKLFWIWISAWNSEQSDDSLDQNSVDFETVRAEPGDDEQEVTLDLYGEDTDQPPDLRTGGHYLDEALAEHERSKNPGAAEVHLNGVGPRQNGVPPSILLQDVDVDLQGLESTEIWALGKPDRDYLGFDTDGKVETKDLHICRSVGKRLWSEWRKGGNQGFAYM